MRDEPVQSYALPTFRLDELGVRGRGGPDLRNGGTGGMGGAGRTARGGWGRWAIRRGMVWRSGNIWGWGKVIQNKGRGEGTELEKNEKRRMIMPSLPCSLYSRSIYTREINKIENV